MANERYDDKYEGHEEGEYHFSDDQVNYDLEAEAPSKEGTAAVVMSKGSVADKIKAHRRIVIGIVVFIVLLGIVYKLVMPSSTAPVTDFSQQATAPAGSITTTKTTVKAAVPAQPSPAPGATQPPAAVAQQVAAMPSPVMQTPAQVAQQLAPTTPPPGVAQQQPLAPPITQSVAQPMQSPAPPAAVGVENAKGALDRIATLEQQNSAIMNLFQTQYAQRLAEAEAQNTQLRTQVQELTNRIGSMEVAFRQLTKILRAPRAGASEIGNALPGMSNASQPVRVVRPRSTYTVQAIIPGRAWLKSEAGDTVTVAEGDMLKDFGRITKIDPYDGIVDIDTGSKVITLSYGTSGD